MSPLSNDAFALRLRLMAEALRPIFVQLCELAGTEDPWSPGKPRRAALIGVVVRSTKTGERAHLRVSKSAQRTAHAQIALAALERSMQPAIAAFVQVVRAGIPALDHPALTPSFLSMDAEHPGKGRMFWGPLVVRVPQAKGYVYSIDDFVTWLVAFHARVGHLPRPDASDPIWLVATHEIPAPDAAQAVFLHQSAKDVFHAWPPTGSKRAPRLPRVSRLEETKPLLAAALELVPR